ncbi:Uncharacterised protein [Mycobacteroides abscessus subsp. abscessus]|nr:Uncharacterised protein [Mycobacteroides abscessus subsp. abscessus]SKY69376.1 Uncharacterised protein [Mycobacteroides abscessus subsp. abscessus]
MSLTASAHRVTVSANTGSASNSSRAMPGYWLPCPVNSHAVVGWLVCSPRTTPGRRRFCASSSRPSRAVWIESTTSAARCSKCDRPRPAVRHTSSRSTSGCAASQDSYRCATAASASGDRADSGSTLTGADCGVDASSSSGVACGWGASSISTCALVPVKPKELTPARRGRPFACHGIALSTTRTGSDSHGMCGDGLSKCRLCGNTPFCNDNTTLIRPAAPEADSVCPMFDLTEPISSGRSASREPP